MENDDLAACIDLCESHGFAAPAAALRALAEGQPLLFLVRAMLRPEDGEHEGFSEMDISPTRRIYRDRAAAERHARRLTARALRNYRFDPYHGFPTSTVTFRPPI